MPEAKLIAELDGYSVYKLPTKIAVFRGEEFMVQQFKSSTPAYWRDPAAYLADFVAREREAEADKIAARRARERFAREYLAKRAARVARAAEIAPQFQF